MNDATCSRCAEQLITRPDDGLCVWCREELIRRAVESLAGPILKDRVAAVWFLRDHGHSASAVAEASRMTKAGATVEEVLAELGRVLGEQLAA